MYVIVHCNCINTVVKVLKKIMKHDHPTQNTQTLTEVELAQWYSCT